MLMKKVTINNVVFGLYFKNRHFTNRYIKLRSEEGFYIVDMESEKQWYIKPEFFVRGFVLREGDIENTIKYFIEDPNQLAANFKVSIEALYREDTPVLKITTNWFGLKESLETEHIILQRPVMLYPGKQYAFNFVFDDNGGFFPEFTVSESIELPFDDNFDEWFLSMQEEGKLHPIERTVISVCYDFSDARVAEQTKEIIL